jgi:hypothetical protein
MPLQLSQPSEFTVRGHAHRTSGFSNCMSAPSPRQIPIQSRTCSLFSTSDGCMSAEVQLAYRTRSSRLRLVSGPHRPLFPPSPPLAVDATRPLPMHHASKRTPSTRPSLDSASLTAAKRAKTAQTPSAADLLMPPPPTPTARRRTTLSAASPAPISSSPTVDLAARKRARPASSFSCAQSPTRTSRQGRNGADVSDDGEALATPELSDVPQMAVVESSKRRRTGGVAMGGGGEGDVAASTAKSATTRRTTLASTSTRSLARTTREVLSTPHPASVPVETPYVLFSRCGTLTPLTLFTLSGSPLTRRRPLRRWACSLSMDNSVHKVRTFFELHFLSRCVLTLITFSRASFCQTHSLPVDPFDRRSQAVFSAVYTCADRRGECQIGC